MGLEVLDKLQTELDPPLETLWQWAIRTTIFPPKLFLFSGWNLYSSNGERNKSVPTLTPNPYSFVILILKAFPSGLPLVSDSFFVECVLLALCEPFTCNMKQVSS